MLNQLVIDEFHSMVSVYFVPVEPLNIGSLFNFKDNLPRDIISGVTERMLRVRLGGHLGTSHRTGDS